jgi:transposase
MAAADPTRLVFVDETHLTLSLTPLEGRGPRGERVVDRVPHRRWESVTFMAGFSSGGYGAAVAIPGPVDGEVLTTYLREALLPDLAAGQHIVWDNLNVHKSAQARQLIKDAGCELTFLPRYSPDFNPIEGSFSKLKAFVRRAKPRSFDELIDALDAGMRTVTATDAAALFAHAGFPISGPHL